MFYEIEATIDNETDEVVKQIISIGRFLVYLLLPPNLNCSNAQRALPVAIKVGSLRTGTISTQAWLT